MLFLYEKCFCKLTLLNNKKKKEEFYMSIVYIKLQLLGFYNFKAFNIY